MKKALIVATLSTFIAQFEKNDIKILQSLGYEVHCAANFENDKGGLDDEGIIKHSIDIQRSPHSIRNLKAYNQLKSLMKTCKFDLVHCHTPMGGVLARVAAKNTHTKPVIYTAHGFHFYRGASIKNILVYKTIEKWLAHYTDALITINHEDYKNAKEFHLRKNGKVFYLPGIGIDIEKIFNVSVNKKQKYNELGLPQNAFVLLSVGELSERKNHEAIIRTLDKVKNNNIIYLVCGEGKLENYLRRLLKHLKLENNIKLLGYRSDIIEICKISDVYVFPSLQEGLPVALMEAMATGLPIICSKIRGNVDLIQNYQGGILCENNIESYSEAIEYLHKNKDLRKKMGQINQLNIKNFDVAVIKNKIFQIYKELK